MAAPTVQTSSQTAGATGVTTYNTAVIASPLANDVDKVSLYVDPPSATITPATGFTLIDSVTCTIASKNFKVVSYWKRLAGTESGNNAWGLSPAVSWVEGITVRVRGCKTSGNPYNISGVLANTSNGTVGPAPSITTTAADCLGILVSGVFDANNQVGGTGDGLTEVVDTNDDIAAYSKTLTTAGTYNTLNVEYPVSTAAAAILIAFEPPATAGGAGAIAPLGMFDKEMRVEAWFDPELIDVAWFDPEMIDVAAVASETFPGGFFNPTLSATLRM